MVFRKYGWSEDKFGWILVRGCFENFVIGEEVRFRVGVIEMFRRG